MARLAILSLILALGGAAAAEAEDPERGRDLAERWCAGCHVVGPEVPGGDAGPAFAAVAARPGQSADAIRLWLADPHPAMPDFDLRATEYDDLAAYILSLAE